jgi:hypothetical protein
MERNDAGVDVIEQDLEVRRSPMVESGLGRFHVARNHSEGL